MNRETIQIPCEDGTLLAGELLIPDRPKAVIQFNAGTAAQRGVYLKLLSYLCGQGYLCCVWDYRGSGQSRSGTLRNSTITYSDYGIKDMPAVKRYLDQRFADLPLFVIGHSTGGQQLGFMPNWQGIRGAIMLAVSTGHFTYMPTVYRLKALLFFYGIVPASNLLTGYVAASKLRIMEDLPTPVAREWGDWLTVPDYFFDPRFYGKTVPEGAFKQFDFPIHNIHATDDSISTPPNIDNYWKHVTSSAGISFERIEPASVGLKRIDHFGYFKSIMQEPLWTGIARRLDGWLEQSPDRVQ